jgi:hypothetical protein
MTTESIETRAVAALAALKDMLNPFKCTHPASRLGVLRGETIDRSDADFSIVTYHLFCRKCSEPIELSYAQMIGGVDGFLSSGFEGSKITPASTSPHNQPTSCA